MRGVFAIVVDGLGGRHDRGVHARPVPGVGVAVEAGEVLLDTSTRMQCPALKTLLVSQRSIS